MAINLNDDEELISVRLTDGTGANLHGYPQRYRYPL
jgi:hypothetical protein